MTQSTVVPTTTGGAWLLEPVPPGAVFTPERLSDEHRLIGRTAEAFMLQEVEPAIPRLEAQDWALARRLVRRAGELGLLGTDVPEAFGGVALDKVSSIVVGERIGRSASFSATYGAQTSLAITPLLMFGNADQKERYLPGLASGELVGAYALSESGAGSDALAAKARAVRQADGSFLLTGEKLWITNGGFADVIIVFAKVEGEHFSAFIVERAFPGVASGKEEHKMGLHGSSTTPIVLQEARVPAENLVGEVGKGHKVAFNVLNYGRLKLAAGCSGGAKAAIGEACRYANTRRQFGQPIAAFGAIQHKIGEMVARAYAVESMLYRTAGALDARLEGSGPAREGAPLVDALEAFAVEASVLKVAASEMLHVVLDENVQIHGGNGFVRDYPAERHYRDARVNRIFEGTNEINRLLIPSLLVRRALKGTLPLVAAAKRLEDELLTVGAGEPAIEGPLPDQQRMVGALKKLVLMVLGTAMRTYGEKLAEQQEVLCAAADLVIDAYAAESALLRAIQRGDPLAADAARLVVHDALARAERTAREAVAAMAEGDTLRTLLAAERRLVKLVPENTVALRRRLAAEALARNAYPFAASPASS
jgi:alkylation response protein AidB-like acyl-CoA dehydrogenase